MIGKKDFFVSNLFAKISKKRVITKKWRFFYRSMRKKGVIAKKSGERDEKRGHKTCVALKKTLSLQKNKEISKNYTYYIITL